MKKYTNLIMALGMAFLVFFSSSCFDVYETIHFKKDGSGHAEFKFDLSEMLDMMKMLGNMGGDEEENSDGDEEKKDPVEEFNSSMDESMAEQKSEFENVPGITNIKMMNDGVGTFGWSFDFANMSALNAALNKGGGPDLSQLGMGAEMSAVGGSDLYFLKGKKLIRKFNEMAKDKMPADDEFESMKFMFENSKYEMNYSFEGNVKKVKTKVEGADYSISGKSVKISIPFLKMMDISKHDIQIKF